MHESPPRAHRNSLARDVGEVTCGLLLGIVLPLPMFVLFAGVPFVLGGVAGICPGPLGLPYDVGLAVWYVVLGSIGGLLPAKPGTAYLLAALMLLGSVHAVILPAAALAAAAWLVVLLLIRLLDSDRL